MIEIPVIYLNHMIYLNHRLGVKDMGIPALTLLFAPPTFEMSLHTSLDGGNTLSVGNGCHGSISL
jgi:hypothetical protein